MTKSRFDHDLLRLLPGYDPFRCDPRFVFDDEAATSSLQFFEQLPYVKGIKRRQKIQLAPWQTSLVANAFGWLDSETGLRRYREIWIYVPKKNGKTTLGTCFMLYHLGADAEPGPEVYSIAASRDQASIIFRNAKEMIALDPRLDSAFRAYTAMRSIQIKDSYGHYRVLAANEDTVDGLDASAVLIDEVHRHDNPEVINVMRKNTAARGQPMLVYMTTADYQRESICNRMRDYAIQVRDGTIDDPHFLPVIYETPIDADWKSSQVWMAANPNYGVSVSEAFMRRECEKAQKEPGEEASFKRLHLNMLLAQSERWAAVSLDDWRACKSDPLDLDELKQLPAYAGLDLSATKDLAAHVLYWPDVHAVMATIFCPEMRAQERERQDRVPYLGWASRGHLHLIKDEKVISYSYIQEYLDELLSTYDVRGTCYDPWQGAPVAEWLEQHGHLVYRFNQNYTSYTEPCKTLEKIVARHALWHSGHPVLEWMMSNVAIKQSGEGHIMPSKKLSGDKIDGITALLMAIGCWLTQRSEAGDQVFGIL